jgi:hypothetical protein
MLSGLFFQYFLPLMLVSSPVRQENPQPTTNEEILDAEPHKLLIVGRWRGFRATEDFTLYYGYEFRASGVYLARHRAYQGQETTLDQFWQGEWEFDGQILRLQGRLTDGDATLVKYQFRLGEDDFLYYQGGELPEPYLPDKMGKLK